MSDPFRLSVEAGPHDRDYCPTEVLLPIAARDCPGIVLKETRSGKELPCQWRPARKGIVLSWLVHGLKAGSKAALLAKVASVKPRKTQVQVWNDVDAGRVKVDIGGAHFTSYHYSPQWVRPFLHPLNGPHGVSLTRHWPIKKGVKGEHRDHPHHKSVWVAYGECGNVDNWSEEPGHGAQRHDAFLALEEGPVMGRIRARNMWCKPNGKKQFEEIREMRFYALPEGLRLFDIDVTFRMTEGAVTFRDTKEGGLLSVRVASTMDVRHGGRIENAYGGIDEGETWGKPSPWCDYSGDVEGHRVGLAVFDHASNPRYPTQWHVRDYGLMTANCFAWRHYCPEAKRRGDMIFKKGQQTTWRYRVYCHKGDARRGRVAQHFLSYVAPPAVRVAD